MLVYAENNQIVFECQYCGVIEKFTGTFKLKRVFQGKINKFKREHDWYCKSKIDRDKRLEAFQASKLEVDQIIKRFNQCL